MKDNPGTSRALISRIARNPSLIEGPTGVKLAVPLAYAVLEVSEQAAQKADRVTIEWLLSLLLTQFSPLHGRTDQEVSFLDLSVYLNLLNDWMVAGQDDPVIVPEVLAYKATFIEDLQTLGANPDLSGAALSGGRSAGSGPVGG